MNFTFDKVYERFSSIYEYEFRHKVEIISDDNDPVYKIDDNQATDLSKILTNHFWKSRGWSSTVEHSFKAIVTEFSSIEFENNEIIGLKTDSLDLQHASNSRLSTESNQGLSL